LRTRIGDWEFDYSSYDDEADILYLSMGPPREGYGEETPEGHFLRFATDGNFYGVTLIDAQRLWAGEGALFVTMPVREEVELSTGQFELAAT
jgi:uncharacterized protein YuzE